MDLTARDIAFKILSNVEKNKRYLNIEFENFINKVDIKEVDKNLVKELVYGVTERKNTLNYIISKMSKRDISKLDKDVVIILQISLYQIVYLNKIPSSAACNEAVKTAKKFVGTGASKFVNAIIRNYLRTGVIYPDETNIIDYLSIKYSHPEWMVKQLVDEFGRDKAKELMMANNTRPSICLRVNTLKTDIDKLDDLFKAEGFKTSRGNICPEALYLDAINDLKGSKLFKDGLFYIQDESSMLVSRVLNPSENDFVIDLCCAPGGKTTHIAQLMNNKGTIIARDKYKEKLKLVFENCKRLGIDIVKIEQADALEFDVNLKNKADKVIVDAPCSGWGVIRKKPDIKWNQSMEDLISLNKIQSTILQNASRYVKIGGYLVYSTCTIRKAENEDIVNSFLLSNTNFVYDKESEYTDIYLKNNMKNGYIKLYQNNNYIDGFFMARLKRIN